MYREPQNKDEDSPKHPPKKRTQNIEMIRYVQSSADLRLELSTLTLAVGQRYSSIFELEYRVKLLARRDGFDFDVPISNTTKVVCECWVVGC